MKSKANTLRCVIMSFIALTTAPVFAQEKPLDDFAEQSDIGSPKLAGSAAFDPVNQEYTVSGAGLNMWFTNDQCHFVWNRMQGDFILRARMQFVGEGKVPHRKAGWMIRQGLEADSPYVDC